MTVRCNCCVQPERKPDVSQQLGARSTPGSSAPERSGGRVSLFSRSDRLGRVVLHFIRTHHGFADNSHEIVGAKF